MQELWPKIWVYPPQWRNVAGLHMSSVFLITAIAGAVCLILSSVSRFYTGVILGFIMCTFAAAQQRIARTGLPLHVCVQGGLWTCVSLATTLCLLMTAVRMHVLLSSPYAPS